MSIGGGVGVSNGGVVASVCGGRRGGVSDVEE